MKGESGKKLVPDMAGDISTEAGVSMLSVSPSGARTIVGSIFNSSSGENSAYRPKEEFKAPSLTQVMYERWCKANKDTPQIDMKDIFEESPIFNKGKKSCPENQHHPEFT